MKSLYITLLFVSYATVALAQKSFILRYQPKLGFVTLSAGASLPMGDFASPMATSKPSGLARTGKAMSLSAGYRLAGVFGLMGRYQQQINAMDASTLLTLPYIEQADTRAATAGQWTVTTVMAGPYVSLPIGRFALDLRALAGPATAICPASRVEGSLGDTPLALSTSQGRARSTALGGGLTVGYRLGRSLTAQVNADYSSATFQFTEMTTTMQDGNRTQTLVTDGQKKIATLNLSAGLTFLFGNRYRPF